MKQKKENIFENNILRLQEISALLESDSIGLDESVSLYEEGIKLSKLCMEILKNAELKITELKKQVDEISAAGQLFDE